MSITENKKQYLKRYNEAHKEELKAYKREWMKKWRANLATKKTIKINKEYWCYKCREVFLSPAKLLDAVCDCGSLDVENYARVKYSLGEQKVEVKIKDGCCKACGQPLSAVNKQEQKAGYHTGVFDCITMVKNVKVAKNFYS